MTGCPIPLPPPNIETSRPASNPQDKPCCQTGYQQRLHDCIHFKIIFIFTMSHFLDIRSQLEKCNKTETSLFQATGVQLLPCLYFMKNMTGLLGAELRSDMLYKPLQYRSQFLSHERGLAAFRNAVNPVKMSSYSELFLTR